MSTCHTTTLRRLPSDTDDTDDTDEGDVFRLLSDPDESTIPPMTVCIAALCENGNAAVVAADRGVAYRHEFFHPDGPDSKIFPVTSHVVFAIANQPLGADFFAQFKKNELSQLKVDEVAERVRAALRELWNREVEQILRNMGGRFESYQKLYDAYLENRGDPVLRQLADECARHNLPTRLFVVGVGNDGARLYMIDEKAVSVKPQESPGFAAIGGGEHLARGNLFARSRRIRQMRLAKAAYYVYEAKKMAERHRGVGSSTDMAVITQGAGVVPLDEDAIKALEEIHHRREPKPLSESEVADIRQRLAAVIPPVAE